MTDFHETRRYGGPQADEGDLSDAARKAEERERKKAEVRKRLEEAGSKKKAKKGFLTPERKKKLRKLLMMKAAEDLKQQQLLKAQERQKALASRIIPLPDIDKIDDKDYSKESRHLLLTYNNSILILFDSAQLEKIYNEMFERVKKLEEEKYDINFIVTQSEAEINELTIAVNDLRGKFVKPTLKKVSKYDNKFKKMAAAEKNKGEKADFRANLKVVKKENAIQDIMSKTKKNTDKPDWSKKPAAEKKEEEAKGESAPPPPAEEHEEEGA
ncbi:Troponin [Dictyocaulus viviparus]|uniref:Troponin n=1 Tax=Dictyocaulus viviparus TaxID=29172 RepID=A0A0D8XSJ4_DICVI|nr:Troponin [Dictyocaulus viviparus]